MDGDATPPTESERLPRSTAPPAAPMPPMCYACGQLLKPEHEKCPSCGAPVRGKHPEGKPLGLKVAGAILVILGVLGIVMAAYAYQSLHNPTSLFESNQTANLAGSFDVKGFVIDDAGARVVNASLTVTPGLETAATDANGSFLFKQMSFGAHVLKVRAANHTPTDLRFVVWQPGMQLNLTAARGAGNATVVVREDASFGLMLKYSKYAIIGLVVAAAIVLISGVLALMGRLFGLVVFGSFLGILIALEMSLLVILLPLMALVLVMRNRRSFRR